MDGYKRLDTDELWNIAWRLLGSHPLHRDDRYGDMVCPYCWFHTEYGYTEHRHAEDCWWVATKARLEAHKAAEEVQDAH